MYLTNFFCGGYTNLNLNFVKRYQKYYLRRESQISATLPPENHPHLGKRSKFPSPSKNLPRPSKFASLPSKTFPTHRKTRPVWFFSGLGDFSRGGGSSSSPARVMGWLSQECGGSGRGMQRKVVEWRHSGTSEGGTRDKGVKGEDECVKATKQRAKNKLQQDDMWRCGSWQWPRWCGGEARNNRGVKEKEHERRERTHRRRKGVVGCEMVGGG